MSRSLCPAPYVPFRMSRSVRPGSVCPAPHVPLRMSRLRMSHSRPACPGSACPGPAPHVPLRVSCSVASIQDPIKRGDLFSQATAKLNEAEGLDNQARSTWLGKGLLRLAKGEIDQAAYQFSAVLGEYEDDVPALLGMANIEYNRKNYKGALRRYKHALRVLPSNMPAVLPHNGKSQVGFGLRARMLTPLSIAGPSLRTAHPLSIAGPSRRTAHSSAWASPSATTSWALTTRRARRTSVSCSWCVCRLRAMLCRGR